MIPTLEPSSNPSAIEAEHHQTQFINPFDAGSKLNGANPSTNLKGSKYKNGNGGNFSDEDDVEEEELEEDDGINNDSNDTNHDIDDVNALRTDDDVDDEDGDDEDEEDDDLELEHSQHSNQTYNISGKIRSTFPQRPLITFHSKNLELVRGKRVNRGNFEIKYVNMKYKKLNYL